MKNNEFIHENFKKYCVSKEYTLFEVCEVMEETHNRVVIVINEFNKVIGIVSQGDILRALLGGKNVYAHVDAILRRDFLYTNINEINDDCINMFRTKKITLLPVVDNNFLLINIITLDNIYDYILRK